MQPIANMSIAKSYYSEQTIISGALYHLVET